MVHRYSPIPEEGAHLALDDILESIEELKYFREQVFILNPDASGLVGVNPFVKRHDLSDHGHAISSGD